MSFSTYPKDVKTIDDYRLWLSGKLDVKIDGFAKEKYEKDTVFFKDSIEKSNMWKSVLDVYQSINSKYYAQNQYDLFTHSSAPTIYIKPFESILDKSFRRNILNNKNFVDGGGEPDDGWITPENWYYRIKDVCRTTFVVKYLDGVEFLANELHRIADGDGSIICTECEYESRDEGYYAAHFCVQIKINIPLSRAEEYVPMWLEIQITTQLQDVIKKLLHRYYEEKRLKSGVSSDWKWNYKSDEFSVNYLGHILHYLEGIIAELRMGRKR